MSEINRPKGLSEIGIYENGVKHGIVVNKREVILDKYFHNDTSLQQQVAYTYKQGSERGYQQEIGLSITASAGFDIGFVSAGGEATIDGRLTASQTFSKSQETAITIEVGSKESIYVYTSSMMVTYWILFYPIRATGMPGTWMNSKHDIIDSGGYVITNNPIPIEDWQPVRDDPVLAHRALSLGAHTS